MFSVDLVYCTFLDHSVVIQTKFYLKHPWFPAATTQFNQLVVCQSNKLVRAPNEQRNRRKRARTKQSFERWSPTQLSVCLSVPSFTQQCEVASPPNHASSGQRSPRRNLLLVLVLLLQGCVSCHLQSTLLKCCHVSWLLSSLLHSVDSRLGSVEVPQSTDD